MSAIVFKSSSFSGIEGILELSEESLDYCTLFAILTATDLLEQSESDSGIRLFFFNSPRSSGNVNGLFLVLKKDNGVDVLLISQNE